MKKLKEAYKKRLKYFDTGRHRERMRKQMRLRRKAEKAGSVREHDGREIDHRDGNYRNNSASNLRITSAHSNRSRDRRDYRKWGK